jgi:hypothetical protein
MSIAPVPLGFGNVPQPEPIVEIKPPALHWALVLLLDLVTVGCFDIYWCFVQARFARRIDDESRASLWYAWWLGTVAGVVLLAVVFGPAALRNSAVGGFLDLACIVCYQAGNFSIKKSLEVYYEFDRTDQS